MTMVTKSYQFVQATTICAVRFHLPAQIVASEIKNWERQEQHLSDLLPKY